MTDTSKIASQHSAKAFRNVLALVATSLVCAAALAQQQPLQPMPTLAPLINRVSPAVVNISVSGSVEIDNPLADDPLFRRFFQVPPDSARPFQSAGSGVIVDAEQRYILTNHHVIENAQEITITLLDKRSMQARVIGSDAASDLAVLQVDTNSLTEIGLSDSDNLSVGDYVIAIGNPFGFSHTVTSGIVSGLGRSGVNPDADAYEDFIQTDASINPGNSGGALVNLNGELVGINSAILSRTGGNIGIGFAIPVNMVRNVMEQIIVYGSVSRGLLGVTIMSISPDIAESYGLENTLGALVTEVSPGSAAEEAGLQLNDIITTVNDLPVRDSGSLRNAIGLLRPSEQVRIGYIRDGVQQSVTAVLNPLLSNAPRNPNPPAESLVEVEPLFEGTEVVPNEAPNGVDGLLLTRVDSGSRAQAQGLRRGDVITHINRQRVRSVADAQRIMSSARSIILQVQRGGRGSLIQIR